MSRTRRVCNKRTHAPMHLTCRTTHSFMLSVPLSHLTCQITTTAGKLDEVWEKLNEYDLNKKFATNCLPPVVVRTRTHACTFGTRKRKKEFNSALLNPNTPKACSIFSRARARTYTRAGRVRGCICRKVYLRKIERKSFCVCPLFHRPLSPPIL